MGKTQSINLFLDTEGFYFVDLPDMVMLLLQKNREKSGGDDQ
ncbi:MAG: hypothetical protein R2771_05550 [Saprospiraceae bacterium]